MCKASSSHHFAKSHSRSTPAEDSAEGYWVPNTDVYSAEEGLVIKVELAGMRREDLELVVDGNRIKISGQRPDCCRPPSKCKFLVMEINYGAFETVIDLPPGYDVGRARAAYQNGFLRIDVPAQEADSPRTAFIPIVTD